MTIEDDMQEAKRRHAQDIQQLGDMSEEELDYLGRLGEIEDPDTDGLEHDDTPKLTEEEWQYVQEMSDG